MLFLNFFADAQPKYVDLEGNSFSSICSYSCFRLNLFSAVQADDLTPEVFASFPSKMTFSWYQARVTKDLMYDVSGSLDLPGQVGRGRSRRRISGLWPFPTGETPTLMTCWQQSNYKTLFWNHRCRGVVPLWDKKWNKSAKNKKAEKKPVSILPTLARCRESWYPENLNCSSPPHFQYWKRRSLYKTCFLDVSGSTFSGRPSWLPCPLFCSLPPLFLSTNSLGDFLL